MDAASKDYLNTGDGFYYFAALHIGATSWYCIADQSGNPFVLEVTPRSTLFTLVGWLAAP